MVVVRARVRLESAVLRRRVGVVSIVIRPDWFRQNVSFALTVKKNAFDERKLVDVRESLLWHMWTVATSIPCWKLMQM